MAPIPLWPPTANLIYSSALHTPILVITKRRLLHSTWATAERGSQQWPACAAVWTGLFSFFLSLFFFFLLASWLSVCGVCTEAGLFKGFAFPSDSTTREVEESALLSWDAPFSQPVIPERRLIWNFDLFFWFSIEPNIPHQFHITTPDIFSSLMFGLSVCWWRLASVRPVRWRAGLYKLRRWQLP